MALLMMTLILSGYSVPIEVADYPYREDPVYLAHMEGEDGWFISLAMSPDSGAIPFIGWVEFPGMLNPAKTFVDFNSESRILSVYSQYPFSANYYLATYLLGDECSLELLEAEGHDYYMEALERIEAAVDSSDFDAALESGWCVMYPMANPYSREMCILILRAGLDRAELMADRGDPPDAVMDMLDDINNLAWNLTNDQLHCMVLDPDDYPVNASITLSEYRLLLGEYAEILLETGEEGRADEVISVIAGLGEED